MKYCDACRATYPSEFLTCPKDQAPLREATELVDGMILRGKYEILAKVGSGGMASVYKARHIPFGEIRAIKVVSSRLADDADFLNRFRTEAVVTRRLQHPSAVRVDDLDATEDGRPFIVMEYVEGESLRALLQDKGALPLRQALSIAGQVAEALGAAHRLGIVHRDVKPENILLTSGDEGAERVKVVDFGIAKVREGGVDVGPGYTSTQTGIVVGTPQYLSPEQASGKRGDELDGRADLYALGLVLYEMVTGQLPFAGHTSLEILLHHVQTTPVPPHLKRPDLAIPPELSALLMRALSKDPKDRFQTGEEMAVALSAVATSTPVPINDGVLADTLPRVAPVQAAASQSTTGDQLPTRTIFAPTTSRTRKNWSPALVGSGVLALLLLAVGVWAVRGRHLSEPGTPGDPTIRAEIKQALSSGVLDASSVEISVEGGVVTLSGRAPSSSDAEIAASMASAVRGVRDVKNHILVASLAPPSQPPQLPAPTEPVGAPRAPVERASPPSAGGTLQEDRPGSAAGRRSAPADIRVRELLLSARNAADREEYDTAVRDLREVLVLDPGNALAQAGLRKAAAARLVTEGRRALASGEPAVALRAFEGALELDPGNVAARLGKRRAHQLQREGSRLRGEPRS